MSGNLRREEGEREGKADVNERTYSSLQLELTIN